MVNCVVVIITTQGLLHVDRVFGGEDSVELKGPEVADELRYYLHLLTLCWHFSKKTFPLFLEETGFAKDNVLIHEPKAGILKPAYTVLVDHNSKCFLLLIRGTHSIKDTLTAATGGIVPFHHTVVNESGVSNLVLGYAHCGMVAAARCIAKLATPCLLKGLEQYPDYKIKVVHSLTPPPPPPRVTLWPYKRFCLADRWALFGWWNGCSFNVYIEGAEDALYSYMCYICPRLFVQH